MQPDLIPAEPNETSIWIIWIYLVQEALDPIASSVVFSSPQRSMLALQRSRPAPTLSLDLWHLVGGIPTPLKNLVSWDDYSIYIISDVPLPCNSDHNWTAQTEHHKNAPNWVYLWSEVPTYSHAQIRKHCFSTTPAEAPWCHQHRHGFSKQSSNGTCFVQALHYKVVLGSTLCKLCSTK